MESTNNRRYERRLGDRRHAADRRRHVRIDGDRRQAERRQGDRREMEQNTGNALA